MKTYHSFCGNKTSAVDNCFVTSGLSAKCRVLTCDTMDVDHTPLLVRVNLAGKAKIKPKVVKRRKFPKKGTEKAEEMERYFKSDEQLSSLISELEAIDNTPEMLGYRPASHDRVAQVKEIYMKVQSRIDEIFDIVAPKKDIKVISKRKAYAKLAIASHELQQAIDHYALTYWFLCTTACSRDRLNTCNCHPKFPSSSASTTPEKF